VYSEEAVGLIILCFDYPDIHITSQVHPSSYSVVSRCQAPEVWKWPLTII